MALDVLDSRCITFLKYQKRLKNQEMNRGCMPLAAIEKIARREDGGGHGGIVHHSDYPIPARVSTAYTLGTFARLIAVGTS
jgi:hypothetical protein